jgi:hypothetical protein
MTDWQIAWAAGLFEGEGSWIVTRGKSAQAYLGMRDRDAVERFMEIVGMGSIKVQRRAHENHSDMYYWRVTNVREVRRLIDMFYPYLCERRRTKADDIRTATEGFGAFGRSKYATHCSRGHEFTPENTYVNPKAGTRRCRICTRERQRTRS